MLATELLAIVANIFYWDYKNLDLVMGHSKVGTDGGVTNVDDNPCVSLDVRLGLCVELRED
jgi:hypothetical protein